MFVGGGVGDTGFSAVRGLRRWMFSVAIFFLDRASLLILYVAADRRSTTTPASQVGANFWLGSETAVVLTQTRSPG